MSRRERPAAVDEATYTAEEVAEAMEVLRSRHGSTALQDEVLDGMERVLTAALAGQQPSPVAPAPTAVDGAAVRWAVERWNDEVANRPLVNVHRRTLDITWRQAIRHFGGDDVALCGPRHDALANDQGNDQ